MACIIVYGLVSVVSFIPSFQFFCPSIFSVVPSICLYIISSIHLFYIFLVDLSFQLFRPSLFQFFCLSVFSAVPSIYRFCRSNHSFLDGSTHLYKRGCPSVRPSVCRNQLFLPLGADKTLDASKGVFSVFSNDKNKNYDTIRSAWEFSKNPEQPQVCRSIRLGVTLF